MVPTSSPFWFVTAMVAVAFSINLSWLGPKVHCASNGTLTVLPILMYWGKSAKMGLTVT